MSTSRRDFLRLLPVLPIAMFAEGRHPVDPDDAEQRDVLERFQRHVTPGSPLGGDGAAPSMTQWGRAVSHFALKDKP